jgi:hypothetical protein
MSGRVGGRVSGEGGMGGVFWCIIREKVYINGFSIPGCSGQIMS